MHEFVTSSSYQEHLAARDKERTAIKEKRGDLLIRGS